MKISGACLGFFLGSLLATGMAQPAAAQSRSAGGEWTGKYGCAQGVTGVRLILSADGSRGVFHFFPLRENPRVPAGCFQITGVFDESTGALSITPGVWYLKPRNYVTVGFNGTVDESGENFEGRITGLDGCASILLSRAPPTLPLPSVCARGLP